MMLYHQLHGFMILWVTLCYSQEDHYQWTNYAQLDRDGRFHVYWKTDDDEITFKTVVATTGYVGFGLSPNGGMQGSDIVIGWVQSGEAYFFDCYADSNSLPKIDPEQDWELLEGQENDTHTLLIFKRKLETCDIRDYPINDDTFRLIYSFNDDDPESFYAIQYHGPLHRGSRSITLLKSQTGQDIPKENVRYWDIKSPNFTITREFDSIYWCSLHKAPPLDIKHHVIKIEAILQKGNERYIHHIVLYQCVGKKSDEGDKYLNYAGHHCYHRNMPRFFHQCQGLYAAWGIGGEPMIMPEEAGLPLGGDEDPYFLLQVHYDNPTLQDNIVDSSGMRLYYVPNLRNYDAMTLMVGAEISRSVIIPPRQKSFIVASHGHPECLSSVMPKEGIHVIAVFLHAHLLGRKLIARHFRNDTELPPLAVDNNYDFNYQGYRFLNNKVKFCR
ncbi:DBH-like monooxygenase protein 1 homolog [Centruroides vittatus]|uniref:DBH-like monooxygenase protein 1 homolog n=1 Tax=Centruroides vittatus TaxID=120091 RepID=UPI00350F6066